MAAPSNKELAVLAVLREEGELTVHQVADLVYDRMPPCVACGGTGERKDLKDDVADARCRRCWGRGKPYFGYSRAYVPLMKLVKRGLASRRHPINEFGDETRGYVYFAVRIENAEETDELEAMFRAPAAEVDS
jgi:hypothetical protein